MAAGRCADPNCTCRADGLRLFTDPVLVRDAAKTDKLVIPLIGGVLARCVLARDAAEPQANGEIWETTTQSLAILDLAAQADRNEPWEDAEHAYGLIASLVLCGWPSLLALASFSYHRSVLGALVDRNQPGQAAAALRFLNLRPPPSWTESVIISAVSCFASADKERSVPILDRNGRRFRVALADRLRREGLVTWPRVLAAAVNDWTVPTLERLAVHHAAAGDAAIELVTRVQEQEERAKEAERDRGAAAPSSIVGAASTTDVESGEAAAAERLVDDAVVEIERWRQERDRVQRERDVFAGRDTRLRSRAESLERELKTARAALARVERQLADVRGERDRLAERLAANEAVEDEAPSSPIPPTVFANRRVLLFTGQDSADGRAALAQGFWDLAAAQVDCYWTDKARGPDTFPADAIIAADVKFMDHSDWHSIQDRARSAGAWVYSGKHGAATMGRAVAAAWLKHVGLLPDDQR